MVPIECAESLGPVWLQTTQALVDLRRFDDAREQARAIANSSRSQADRQSAQQLEQKAKRLATHAARDAKLGLEHFDVALQAERDGRYEEASKQYLKAWETLQPNASALFGAARVARRRGDPPASAQRLFDRSLVEMAALDEEAKAVPCALSPYSRATPLSLSQDRTLLLLADRPTVEVWDLKLGTVLYRLTGEFHLQAGFAPDGRLLAISDLGNKHDIELRHAASGHLVRSLTGHTDAIQHLKFTDDGRLLVSADRQRVLVHEVDTGNEVAHIDFPHDISRLVVVPERDTLLLADDHEHVAGLYDLRTGKRLQWLPTPGLTVGAISPDASHLALIGSGSKQNRWTRSLVVVGSATGESERVIELSRDSEANQVEFASDQYLMATIRSFEREAKHQFRVWSVPDGGEILSLSAKQLPVFEVLSGGLVAVWIEDQLMIVDVHKRTVRPTPIKDRTLWSSQWVMIEDPLVAWARGEGEMLARVIEKQAERVARMYPTQSPRVKAEVLTQLDSTSLAVGDEAGLRRLTVTPFSAERLLKTDAEPRIVTAAGDGHTLLVVEDNQVDVYDWASRRRRHRVPSDERVRTVVVSDNGTRFAVLTYDGSLKVYDTMDASRVLELDGPTGNAGSIALDSEGRAIATGDGLLVTVDQRIPESFPLPPDLEPGGVGLSADGRRVAFAHAETLPEGGSSEDETTAVVVYGRKNRELEARVSGPGILPTNLWFSRDGEDLAVDTIYGSYLVDIENREVVTELEFVGGVFDRENRWIAGIEDDGGIVFHELEAGMQLAKPYLDTDADSAVAVAPDGRFEVIGKAPLSHLECRAGSLSLPIEVCRDPFESPGLVAEVLGGEVK